MTDQPAHGCTIDGQPAMPILVTEYNALVARADGAQPELDRLTAELADYDERAEQQKQRAGEAEQHLRNIAQGSPHANAVQAEIGEMIRQTHELREQLERARRELADRDAADSEAAAAGSYANGNEHAIAHPQPWLHILFTSPYAATANTSALAIRDHLAAEFDGVRMRITGNAVESEPSCSPGAEETELNNPAATEATGLRTRVTALYGQWVKAGPPPLGVPTARWWDRRLVELRAAIHTPAEQPRTTPDNPAASGDPGEELDAAATVIANQTVEINRLTDDLYRAQDTLALIGERCDTADVLHKAITTADVRAWLKGTRCAREAAAEQPGRTTANNQPEESP